jgi:hypothetical protein
MAMKKTSGGDSPLWQGARWWRGVDDVNDRLVGNPKRRCDEHSIKFSLSYETKVCQSSRKKPNSRKRCLLA